MNTIPNKKYLDYSILEQIKDVKSSFLLSAAMAIAVYVIGMININIFLLVTIQFLLGVIFYLTSSHYLKLESYLYLKETIIEKFRK